MLYIFNVVTKIIFFLRYNTCKPPLIIFRQYRKIGPINVLEILIELGYMGTLNVTASYKKTHISTGCEVWLVPAAPTGNSWLLQPVTVGRY